MLTELVYGVKQEKENELKCPARLFYEFPLRDRGEGCTTGQPQGVGSEAYLNSTSQGPTPEEARMDDHIRGRSRQFVKQPG
jgi:hypothetical protein